MQPTYMKPSQAPQDDKDIQEDEKRKLSKNEKLSICFNKKKPPMEKPFSGSNNHFKTKIQHLSEPTITYCITENIILKKF